MNDINTSQKSTNVQQRTQKGASLVEYALLVALISVVAIVAMTALGNNARVKLGEAAAQMQN